MKMEIDNLISDLKPRKRPMDIDPFDSPRPTKRRLFDTMSSTPPRAIKLETSESDNFLSGPLIVSSDSENSELPHSVDLVLKRSKQVDPSQLTEARNSSHLSRAKQDTAELSSDSEDDGVRSNQASSLHASWPLKYVRSMADGFDKMETMSSGTLSARFYSSFGLPFPASKATWNMHSNIWNAATTRQRAKFIQSGFTPDGLWKNFVREVRARYPNGKVPGKRANLLGKGKKLGKPVKVKREEHSINKVKAEPDDSDIILIDSDNE